MMNTLMLEENSLTVVVETKRVTRITRAILALGVRLPQNLKSKLARVTAITVTLTSVVMSGGLAHAGTLTVASVALSDPRPSQTSSYTVTASSVTNGPIRCVQLIWSTSPTAEAEPTGFDATAGTVTAASSTLINSSATGWTLTRSDGSGATAGADNKWQYTRSSDVTPSTLSGATFVTAGITNGSTHDVGYYLRVNTYTDQSCTTPRDDATVQFIYTRGSTLSLTVDNTLSFTVNAVGSSQSCNGTTTTQASTATTIPFGTVTSAANGVVCQDLTAATNATNGYTIYIRNTGDPANALSQTIADHSGTNGTPTTFSAAGTEAYGYTTDDATLGTGSANRFTNGGQKWAAGAQTNEELAYEATGVSSTTYRIGHQVGISPTTDPGTYTTTVIYTCTPVY